MSSAEIADGPVKDGLFTLDEVTALYRQQFSTEKDQKGIFNDELRSYPENRKYVVALSITPRVARSDYSTSSPKRICFDISTFGEGVRETTDLFGRLCRSHHPFDIFCDNRAVVRGTTNDCANDYEVTGTLGWLFLHSMVDYLAENLMGRWRMILPRSLSQAARVVSVSG